MNIIITEKTTSQQIRTIRVTCDDLADYGVSITQYPDSDRVELNWTQPVNRLTRHVYGFSDDLWATVETAEKFAELLVKAVEIARQIEADNRL